MFRLRLFLTDRQRMKSAVRGLVAFVMLVAVIALAAEVIGYKGWHTGGGPDAESSATQVSEEEYGGDAVTSATPAGESEQWADATTSATPNGGIIGSTPDAYAAPSPYTSVPAPDAVVSPSPAPTAPEPPPEAVVSPSPAPAPDTTQPPPDTVVGPSPAPAPERTAQPRRRTQPAGESHSAHGRALQPCITLSYLTRLRQLYGAVSLAAPGHRALTLRASSIESWHLSHLLFLPSIISQTCLLVRQDVLNPLLPPG